jgi:hypothetical protein
MRQVQAGDHHILVFRGRSQTPHLPFPRNQEIKSLLGILSRNAPIRHVTITIVYLSIYPIHSSIHTSTGTFYFTSSPFIEIHLLRSPSTRGNPPSQITARLLSGSEHTLFILDNESPKREGGAEWAPLSLFSPSSSVFLNGLRHQRA